MFYFFKRGRDFRRYEVRTNADGTYEVIVSHPDGRQEVHQFDSTRDLNEQWQHLQEQLTKEGWWGPYGRDL